MSLKVIAAGRTDVGLHREHNEDCFVLLEHHGLYLVADGMGGHLAGDVASQLATASVGAFFDSTAREDATWPFHYDPGLSNEENRLVTGVKVANRAIYEESVRNPDRRGMGTTVVGVLMSPDVSRAYVAHVGDSRCYRVRGQEITLLTQDHSLVNEYLRAMPELTPAQRLELPRNVITRALGMSDIVMVDLSSHEVAVGDVFVLCSDGLSGMISDAEILSIVGAHRSVEGACRALVALANDHGGDDNITAVVLRVVDPEQPETVPPPGEETQAVRLPEMRETDPDGSGVSIPPAVRPALDPNLVETLPPPPLGPGEVPSFPPGTRASTDPPAAPSVPPAPVAPAELSPPAVPREILPPPPPPSDPFAPGEPSDPPGKPDGEE